MAIIPVEETIMDELRKICREILNAFDNRKGRKKWCWHGDGDEFCPCPGCKLLSRLRREMNRKPGEKQDGEPA